MTQFDVLVIGSGPAGFYAALTSAKKGWKTALAENAAWGGTGFSSGCLPVKKLLDHIRIAEEASLEIDGREIIGKLKDHSISVADRERTRLEEAGVHLFHGEGVFKDSVTYVINSKEIRAEKIVIATGSEPSGPGNIIFGTSVISHREAVRLDRVSRSLIIVGGDVEGVEFASLFSSLGAHVRVIEQLDSLLPGYDRDLVEPVIVKLKSTEVNCSETVQEISAEDNGAVVFTDKGRYEAEKVLVTGMRSPSIPEGLIDLDIAIGDGYIKVDENCETTVPGIFAIGDINGKMGLGSSAIQQAVQLCDYFETGRPVEWDFSLFPRAVYTSPQICGAGMQEKDIPAREKQRYKIYKSLISDSWRAYDSDHPGHMVKIVCDDRERIKGIWFTGVNGEYLGQSASYIIRAAMTVSDLRRDLYIHPTEFESILEAVL